MKLVACAALLLLAACAAPSSQGSLSPNDPLVAARGTHAKLLLDDEFNGTSLDAALWSTCYPWAQPRAGCSNNPGLELEWYVPRNVSVGGGFASLTATSGVVKKGYPYSSGMISTGGDPHRATTFGFLYGYAEARIRLPRGAGMWPAFWLVPANRTWPPEIDIMEWQGVLPKDDLVTVHWGTAKHPLQSSSSVDTGVDLWRGYHTYAVDWEPGAIIWYFDGKPVKRCSDARHIPHQPMYVILNLAIGGWVSGQLNPSPSRFPATMSIDYLRIWNTRPN